MFLCSFGTPVATEILWYRLQHFHIRNNSSHYKCNWETSLQASSTICSVVVALQISRQVLVSIMGLFTKLLHIRLHYDTVVNLVRSISSSQVQRAIALFTTDVSLPHLHSVLDCLGKQQPSCRVIERRASERESSPDKSTVADKRNALNLFAFLLRSFFPLLTPRQSLKTAVQVWCDSCRSDLDMWPFIW